jgi:hypothetical protein
LKKLRLNLNLKLFVSMERGSDGTDAAEQASQKIAIELGCHGRRGRIGDLRALRR